MHQARPGAATPRVLDDHPTAVLSVKAGLAALIAWIVVAPVGGFLDNYQYYAPIGAMVTASSALTRATRATVQAVLAILVGGLLAIATQALPLAEPFAIAIVVGAGVAISYWGRVAMMGSWVPFVALFALVLHDDRPWQYVIAFALLTAVGALVGLAVDWALPQLPTGPVVRAEGQLADELADALEEFADAVRTATPMGFSRQDDLTEALEWRSHELREALRHASDARLRNWRARATQTAAERLWDRARSLQRLTSGVVHVIAIADDTWLSATSGSGPDDRGLPAALRSQLVDVLGEAAQWLREGPRSAAATWSPEALDALARLRDALATGRAPIDDEGRLALIGVAAEVQHIARGAGRDHG